MQPKICFEPGGVVIRVRPGTTLLAAAKAAKVPVRTRCGGKAGCLMCKVKVVDGQGLSSPSQRERQKLGGSLRQHIRLACQTVVHGDAVVEVPEDPLKAVVRRQLAQLRGEADE